VALLDDLPHLIQTGREPAWTPAAVAAIQATVIGFVVTGGLLLPALFLWAYRDEAVLRTCERHDADPGWADRCPWPVLLLSLELALAALLTSFMVLRPAVPLFGVWLTGWTGALLLLAGAVWMAWLALGVYRLSVRAWWGTTLLLLLVGVSVVVTSLLTEPDQLYRVLGYPETRTAVTGSSASFARAVGVWGSLGFTVVSLIYMAAIRHHFRTRPLGDSAGGQT
jgi:hypothetical protein